MRNAHSKRNMMLWDSVGCVRNAVVTRGTSMMDVVPLARENCPNDSTPCHLPGKATLIPDLNPKKLHWASFLNKCSAYPTGIARIAIIVGDRALHCRARQP
eukprot:TRINITY_DN102583_c0_g1_i1.p1 TRINITY_DN102583_c0_g1~~TRINITY_DN102583_c0_g1_i1.p1  ORF type:complete len:101 (+),score=10.55 TRINITY_DN102583_c0_g1_i1:262-564(+)